MLLLLTLAAVDPPDPARALEARIVQATAAAEPGVALVVVSHRPYPTQAPADKPWLLGGFDRFTGRGPRFGRAYDPRDLADPQAAADNTFGSGLVLTNEGLILTAYHLIDGATKVYVRPATGGGSYADVHAADARSDLAVLKLTDPPPNLQAVKLANARTRPGPRGEPATVRRGQFVIALGHPLAAGAADASPSVAWGILSNLRRRLASAAPGTDNRTRPLAGYPTLLQTDARATLGCSGGGLFDLDGEAIGLTTAAAGVVGAETAGGYAVPFDVNTRRAVEALAAGREVEYGFLGVTLSPFDRGFGGGVVVSGVTPGMPADRAGLRANDRIIAIDGQPVDASDDLFLHVGSALAGSSVSVGYARGPRRMPDATAVLAKHSHGLPWVASRKRPAPFGLRPDWASVLVVDRGGGPGGPAGVLVKELEPGSPAEQKLKPLGVEPGRWLVTFANGQPVPTPDAFLEAADRPAVRLQLVNPADPGPPVEVTLP
jgi:serine protease Do